MLQCRCGLRACRCTKVTRPRGGAAERGGGDKARNGVAEKRGTGGRGGERGERGKIQRCGRQQGEGAVDGADVNEPVSYLSVELDTWKEEMAVMCVCVCVCARADM